MQPIFALGRPSYPSARFWLASVCVCLAAGWSAVAQAEVFMLHTGGKVEGELLNPEESPRQTYVVKTAAGKVTLDATQVKDVIKQRPDELEYAKIRGDYADTVEGQLGLAQWCRDHHLSQQRRTHLERVIELSPDHPDARRMLGFQKRDGEWKTQAQIMSEKGYVKDTSGRWVLPQEIELRERDRKHELAQKEWFKRIKLWRHWLNTERAMHAAGLIAQISEPYAIPALLRALGEEISEDRRKLFLQALARINTPAARLALADRSIADPNEDVRLTCLEHLQKTPDAGVVKQLIAGLKSKDNLVVNRAAVGLSYMNDPTAIGPLIDALVTKHKFKVQVGTPGYTTTFGNNGVNGFSAGGGPRIVTEYLQNPAVRDALVTLADGPNFEYDVRQWKVWLASQKKAKNLNARRDAE